MHLLIIAVSLIAVIALSSQDSVLYLTWTINQCPAMTLTTNTHTYYSNSDLLGAVWPLDSLHCIQAAFLLMWSKTFAGLFFSSFFLPKACYVTSSLGLPYRKRGSAEVGHHHHFTVNHTESCTVK